MENNFIYFDNASTTPLSENVLNIINSTYRNYWHNHSSTYELGIKCSTYLEKIRCEIASIFEKNELFPEKTNVHFCQILNRDNIKVKVWERGAGPTLACGTGACAIHVAAYKLGLCNSQTIVTLPGGNLKINWSENDCEVMMTGNAKKVFTGSMLVN